MRFFYNFLIVFVQTILPLFTPFSRKLKERHHGLKNWQSKLKAQTNNKPNIWLHCSSLGEYEDAIEVYDAIISSYKEYNFFLSFFSPSGYEIVKHDKRYHYVFYMPLDTKKNARTLIDILNPKYALFSRSEIWPNYLEQLRKNQTSSILLSSLIQQTSGFIKWPARNLFRASFNSFQHIYCQDETTKNYLEEVFQCSSFSITGNTRIDRIYNATLEVALPKELEDFIGSEFCVIVGSCLDKGEQMALSVIDKLSSIPIKWIIVPHEIDTTKIDQVVSKQPEQFIKYSNIQQLTKEHNILYFDNVGQLKHLYRLADLAIIGGGFSKMGIHSILEPAVYGVPVTFGPNHRNYTAAIDLLDLGAARIHNNEAELEQFILNLFNNPPLPAFKEKIKNYVKKDTGASQKIIQHLKQNILS